MTLIHSALSTQKPNARYGFMAPFLKQAKGAAWDYLKQYARPVPHVRINESELRIEFPNGARIQLTGGDNADALRGQYFDGIVIDEMADLKPDVWEAIVRPTLADRRGWALFIGTPRGLNKLYDLYDAALNGFKREDGSRFVDPEWSALLYRVDETQLICTEELESSRLTMSESLYRQEWLCDFTAANDNVLITIDMVVDACNRQYSEADLAGSSIVMGVDVARFGDDRSVIQLRKGLWALEPEVHRGRDNMFVAYRVAELARRYQCDCVFIDIGGGAGVVDRLRDLGLSCPVVDVNFGSKATDPTYRNKRTEMWDELRQWLERGGHLPQDAELKADLCAPTYHYDSSGRKCLEDKDEIKKRLTRSPDCGDALALTFAAPVQARRHDGLGVREARKIESEYHPFAQAYAGVKTQEQVNSGSWKGIGRWNR